MVAPEIPALEVCEIGGRICSAQGFGDVKEKFITYDEASMCYSYEAVSGLPSFSTNAVNNWSVHATGPNQCVVESRAEIEAKRFPGIILTPIFKVQMGLTALPEPIGPSSNRSPTPHPETGVKVRQSVGALAKVEEETVAVALGDAFHAHIRALFEIMDETDLFGQSAEGLFRCFDMGAS